MSAPQQDLLTSLLPEVHTLIKRQLPDWTPPDRNKHPYANLKRYTDPYAMLVKLMDKPGIQIVADDASGYGHHGIFVGQQVVKQGGKDVPAVVDVWGHSKEKTTISLRPYDDFIANSSLFAEVAVL